MEIINSPGRSSHSYGAHNLYKRFFGRSGRNIRCRRQRVKEWKTHKHTFRSDRHGQWGCESVQRNRDSEFGHSWYLLVRLLCTYFHFLVYFYCYFFTFHLSFGRSPIRLHLLIVCHSRCLFLRLFVSHLMQQWCVCVCQWTMLLYWLTGYKQLHETFYFFYLMVFISLCFLSSYLFFLSHSVCVLPFWFSLWLALVWQILFRNLFDCSVLCAPLLLHLATSAFDYKVVFRSRLFERAPLVSFNFDRWLLLNFTLFYCTDFKKFLRAMATIENYQPHWKVLNPTRLLGNY